MISILKSLQIICAERSVLRRISMAASQLELNIMIGSLMIALLKNVAGL